MNYSDYSFNILPYGCNQDDQVIVLTDDKNNTYPLYQSLYDIGHTLKQIPRKVITS